MSKHDFTDIHKAKDDLIALGLPTDLLIDFGPTFRPQYLNRAAKLGAKQALGVDAEEPELDNGIDFYKADFSKDSIVPWIMEYRVKHPGRCLGITFDTLLHQYAPLHVLRNLLSVLDAVSIGTPVLKQASDTCVFLPSVPEEDQEEMFPDYWMVGKPCFASPATYTWANWLWGLSADLLKTWVQREGFSVLDEKTVSRPKAWEWWGCYAVRTDSS